MTNFLRDSAPRRLKSSRHDGPNKNYILLGVFLVIIVLFFGRHFFSARVVAFARPLWILEESVSNLLSPFTSVLASKSDLSEQNTALLAQVEEKSLEIQRLNLVLDEYRDITVLFGESIDDKEPGRIASIYTRPPVSPFDSLIVKGGIDMGTLEKDYAYGPGGVLIGEVIEVYPKTAKVSLYSTPGSEHEGFIKDIGPITLTGQGNGNFTGQLPKSEKVGSTTLITLPGEGSILALVGTSTVKEGESIQTVSAQLPLNIQTLQWVRLVHHE